MGDIVCIYIYVHFGHDKVFHVEHFRTMRGDPRVTHPRGWAVDPEVLTA